MTEITNMQKAKHIISYVGKEYQRAVCDKLLGLIYYPERMPHEKQAQQVIGNMYKEYLLNLANVLWADRYADIPDHVKEMSDTRD